MSPEIVYQQSHGFAVDVWCLGILFYEMLHGNPPFKGENLQDIKKEFKNKRIEISPKFTQETRDLIKKLLDFDSRTRIKIDEVLNHPVFTNNKKHIDRKITREEYNLLIKYYYMNSGGNRLLTHNSTFASQFQRESMLSINNSNNKSNFFQKSSDSPFGIKDNFSDDEFFKDEDNDNNDYYSDEEKEEKFNDLKKKDNIKLNKFDTPDSNKQGNRMFNDFEPKKFMSPSQIPPHLISNFKKKNAAENNISNYNPPSFFKQQEIEKIKKSSLKKKLQSLNKNNKGQISNSSFSLLKKDSLKKKLEKRQNYLNSTNSGIKKIVYKMNAKENDKIPIRSISLRKLHNKESTLSNNLSKLLNKNNINNLSNYSSNPSKNLTLTEFQKKYSTINSPKKNKLKKSVEKSKVLKRDTSQSIERKLETRVIKASASLPKVLHKFNENNTKKVPLLTLVKNDNHKTLFEKLRKKNQFLNVQTKKDSIKKNLNKTTYLVQDPIPEELYLSNFDTVKESNNNNNISNFQSLQSKKMNSLKITLQDRKKYVEPEKQLHSISSIKQETETFKTEKTLSEKLMTIKSNFEEKLGIEEDLNSSINKSKSIFLNYDFDDGKTKEDCSYKNFNQNSINKLSPKENKCPSIILPSSILNDNKKFNFDNISRISEKSENSEISSIRKDFDISDSIKKKQDDKQNNLSKILEETESMTLRSTNVDKYKSLQNTKYEELKKEDNKILEPQHQIKNEELYKSHNVNNLTHKSPSVNYVKRIVFINGKKVEKLIKCVSNNNSENNSNKDTMSRNSFKPSISSQKKDNLNIKKEDQVILNVTDNRSSNVSFNNKIYDSITRTQTRNSSNRVILNSYQNSNNNKVQGQKSEKDTLKNLLNKNQIEENKNNNNQIELNQQKKQYQFVKFEDSFIINNDDLSFVQPERQERYSTNVLLEVSKNTNDFNSSYFKTVSNHKKNNTSDVSQILHQSELKYSNTKNDDYTKNPSITSSTAGRVVRKLYLNYFKKQDVNESRVETSQLNTSTNKYNLWQDFDFEKTKDQYNKQQNNDKNNITNLKKPEDLILKNSPNKERTSNRVLSSINIKQLPGLKESNSLGKLQIKNSNFSYFYGTKNPEAESSTNERTYHIRNSSITSKNQREKSRSKSRLRKIIDTDGNVRYKWISGDRISPTKKDLKTLQSKVFSPFAVDQTNSKKSHNLSFQTKIQS